MKIYWSIHQLPELKPLSRTQRKQLFQRYRWHFLSHWHGWIFLVLYVGVFWMALESEKWLPVDEVPWWLEFGTVVVLMATVINVLYIGRLYGARTAMKEEVESWKQKGEEVAPA